MAMGEVQLQAHSGNISDALHERPMSLRRARPPNIDLAQGENRVPLRAEKAKAGKGDKDIEEDSSRNTSRSPSIRASLVDFSSWPYRLHSSRSEASLVSPTSVDSRSTSSTLFSPHLPHNTSDKEKLQPIPPVRGRIITKPWSPPPLFQVYPQAVKHATLPVCNIPLETLARYSETGSKPSHSSGIKTSEHWSDSGLRTKGDTLKKKQKLASLRNPSEWTSKIFVLVTSGYLLQYAAEGTFNRTPEKILQLTATSAAYASDLIPGRHWVLQVASTTDADGNTFMNPRSRRSKLSMRDGRHVSNMLLVFEDPESMDKWLAILRREIEINGGKRRLSETGKVEADDLTSDTTPQPSHRTIVAKDRNRFSRSIPRDFSYTQENALVESVESDFAVSLPQRLSTYTIDNSSPTASMISTDGQRLDNLRDSGSSHRFSYMSSGQRTMVTSEGSSPACSPTRASFSSQGEDLHALPSLPEVRLRPNAAAIVNRRQSMQTMISSLEAPLEQSSRSYSNSTMATGHDNEQISGPSVPNFSVPHAAGKRFSLNASVPGGPGHLSLSNDHERNGKSLRKTPPTALLMSRPLSIVIDQPSPRSPRSPNSLSISVDSCQSSMVEPKYTASVLDPTPEQTSLIEAGRLTQSSEDQPSQPSNISEANSTAFDQIISSPGSYVNARVDESKVNGHITRAASSLGSYGPRRKLSGTLPNKESYHKRSSWFSENGPIQNPSYASTNTNESKTVSADSKANLAVKSSCSPKRSAPSLRPPPQSLTAESQEMFITPRRSMPQLKEGPPLAPPPNCALPPIPRKSSAGHNSIEV
ncbi:hypothetical protein NPX13_g1606 [Xylaria arbuscula]|uniref:PH domain-containing protein n=1 Tax=Xylaria arbuscula TaxID=114810 RepID=A0A9W8NLS2_9PEZI|nr:hypothetical protein NPX13_g1606 [Xylaria arbuscula]